MKQQQIEYEGRKCKIMVQLGNYVSLKELSTGKWILCVHISKLVSPKAKE